MTEEFITEPLLVWQCNFGFHTWGNSICIACGTSRTKKALQDSTAPLEGLLETGLAYSMAGKIRSKNALD